MSDNFPDDSLFRNSNVAYLEDILNGKEKCVNSLRDVRQKELSNITKPVVSSDEFKWENSLTGSQPGSLNTQAKKGTGLNMEKDEDSFGLPRPHTEELKFESFDFCDLSNVIKEHETLHVMTAQKLVGEEKSAVASTHPLTQQNPPATIQKSFSSDDSDSNFSEKSEQITKEKSTIWKKSLQMKKTQISGYCSSTSSKRRSRLGRSARLKNFPNEKSIVPEEKPKLEKSKKNGYQPLQLNITKNSRHESFNAKKKRSPDHQPSLINKSELIMEFPNQSETTENFSLPSASEISAQNTTNSVNDTLLTTQQKLQLESWGFPETILAQYARRGVTQMFPWQVECLCQANVLSGGNLIYSAPTSAGKTLVAEILCIKTVLERKKKAIFILPFVSVVREKMFYFQDLLGSSGIRVEGFMGGHSPPGGFRNLDIAVCTIEKANGFVNRLLEDEGLSSLGAVVVDELHLLGDPFRGYLLELLLTKLKYMSQRKEGVKVQIIGMSATLPNLSLLSTWLDAALYSTSYRPVPLSEYVKIGPQVYDNQLKLVRTLNPEIKIKGDSDYIVYLCLETVVSGHSVLIFCPTKNWCESLALSIAEEFRKIGQNRDPNAPESIGYKLREELNANAIMQTLEQLKRSPAGLDDLLARTVSFGVSFHHAGMTLDERDIIEGSFRQGSLRVIVATSTLSSGVNLPARRVIIRSPTFHGRMIDVLSYKQMIGRAGRMGKDTAGESFLICSKPDQRLAEKLVKSSLRPVISCLGQKGISSSLKRAVLEVVVSGVAQTPEEVEVYIGCTLLAASSCNNSPGTSSSFLDPVMACVDHLRENEFIRLQQCEDGTTKYVATPLGYACLSASISPDEGLTLFKELQRARQCFVLETELHVIYQVTPFSVSEQWGELDWLHVLSLWEKLSPEMKRVGELVGVEDRFIVRAMKGTVNLKSEKQHQRLIVHRRFYTALALHDLVNEVPIIQVAAKFGCSRGMLQSLQQTASTFAGMVTAFSRRLGWNTVEILVEQFQDRLHFGTHRELLDLLRLPLLNGPRARAIFNSGISSVTELTTADPTVVENALLAATPFESAKGRDGESENEMERRRRMKSVWVCGREGLTARQAAELLIGEARILVQKELGVKNMDWQQTEVSITVDESRLSRSRNELSILRNGSINSSAEQHSRILEDSSTFIDLSKKEGDAADDSVFKIPIGGPVRKVSKKVSESKENAKRSPTKIERILKSIEIEPVKMPQVPEIIIGQKFSDIPGPSKSNHALKSSVETDRSTSSAKDGDVSARTSTRETFVSTGITCRGTDVSAKITTKNTDALTELTEKNILPTEVSSRESDVPTRSTTREPNVSTKSIIGEPNVSSKSTIREAKVPSKNSIGEANVSTRSKTREAKVSTRSTTREANVSNIITIRDANVSNVSTTREANDSNIITIYDANVSNISTTREGNVSTRSTTSEANVSNISTTTGANVSNISTTREVNVSARSIREADVSTKSLAKDERSLLSSRTSFSVCETSTNSDIFEQNICEIDAALHSSMNSPVTDVKEKVKVSSDVRISQAKSPDIFLGSSSLFESIKDMSSMRQPDNTKQEAAKIVEVQGANSAISGDSGMGDVCLSMSSMSESAFTKPIHEKKIVDRKTDCSPDIFSSQNEIPIAKTKRNSVDRSLPTPSPPWNLRSRKGSSSGSRKRRRSSLDDMFASPLLAGSPNTKSPSLFGESFEIDSQLRNILDCNDPATVKNAKVADYINSSEHLKRKHVGDNISPVTIFIDSCGSNNSFDLNSPGLRTRSAKRKFFGSARKNLTPTDLSTSAINGNENTVSQSTPLRPPPSEKCEVASILTDSFLEAAFQSAFEYDNATTTKKVSPPQSILKEPLPTARLLKYSPAENNELNRSSEDEILSTPHKKRKIDKVNSANDRRRKNSDPQINDEKSPTETGKLQPSKMAEKDAKTGKRDNSDGIVCPPGRPVGLSVPRPRISLKDASKTSNQNQNKVKMNVENSKTDEKINKRTSDWSKLNIIDVCENKQVFNEFKKSIFDRGTLSVALGCEHVPENPKEATTTIGTRVMGMPRNRSKSSLKLKEPALQYEKIRLVSLAVCAGHTDVYHVCLSAGSAKGCLAVSFEDRMDFLRKLFAGHSTITIACFDLKEHYKMLYRCARIVMSSIQGRDLKIADWLIEPEGKEKNLLAMALNYYPSSAKIAEMSGCKSSRRAGSAALNTHLEVAARTRSCAEAVVCWHVSRAQVAKLKEMQIFKSFTDVEMPVALGFARLELNGIGFDREVALSLRERLKSEMSILQERAYELAGRTFSLSSSNETARVIYQELGLGNAQKTQGARSFASTGSSGVQKMSTNKQALSRLRNEHPLPEVILTWRKLSYVMSKTFYPLLKTEATDRLFGFCILHTATGRISMHEPNLQNMPRDFDFQSDSTIFSVRSSFVPKAGNVFVAADYSQLELRLLAHLSGDITLRDILNSGRDVFRSIAMSWNNIPEDEVTDELRQRAKQVCYGMIYGIGKHALAEQLGVEDDDAEMFMISFKSAYPGVNTFLQDTVQECRTRGYVKTMMGRRRYLPAISCTNAASRAHAERQAVNTTVQGSAADLTKAAMITVDREINRVFSSSSTIISSDSTTKGAYLVLQLHDELLYEVSEDHVNDFIEIVRRSMETAVTLSVKLPVKVRTGPSWGMLQEVSPK